MDSIKHTVREIELAVSRLSPQELVGFRKWFDEFDAMSGRLDELASQAISDFRAGKCKEL
jgi:hypothetical protein